MLPKLRSLFVCTISLLAAATTLAQNTIHVPADQLTIQAGIDAANNGDTVVVSSGTYYENIDFKGKYISVMSSAGAATTIIDGSKNNSPTVTIAPGSNPLSGIGLPILLQGFTIQNGGTEPSAAPTGGIYINQMLPTISLNTLTHNHCAGIWIAETQGLIQNAPLIQSNEIDNTLDNHGDCPIGGGSAIVVTGGLPEPQPLSSGIVDNLIQNNTQGGQEGTGSSGISVLSGSLVIQNNILHNNITANAGGAIYLAITGAPVIQNLIYDNQAACGGGAIAIDRSLIQPSGTLLIDSNTFLDNTLSGQSCVTSISQAAASQVFLDDTFTALFGTLFVNNIFSGSTTQPAIACSSIDESNGLVDLPIFDHNILYNSAGPVFDPTTCVDQSALYGNKASDPQFVDPLDFDFHLQRSSPAIDSGQTYLIATEAEYADALIETSKDIGGQPRIADGTGIGYSIVDMGAYEYTGAQDALATSLTVTNSLENELVISAAGGALVNLYAVASSPANPTSDCTGPVQFFEDGTTIGSVNLSNSNATLNNFFLTPGTHYIDATYAGQPPCNSAAATPHVFLVDSYISNLTLSSNNNPSNFGQPVTFLATITSPDPNQGGPLYLTDGNGTIPLATLTPVNGTASFTTSTLAIGNHDITLDYRGDSTHHASDAGVLQIVNAAANPATTTTLAITAAGSPVTTVPTGTVVTLTATTLASASPVSPGQVNFCDATAPNCLGLNRIGTAQLTTAGIAALKFVPSPGTHSYKAVFLGTSTNTTSSSAAQPLTVTSTSNPATITLADTGVPGNYTLTATVTGVAATTPTGSVSFLDTTNANYLLGSATLSTGTSGLIWTASTVPTNVSPGSLVAADFNNDGYPDVALTTRDSVSILNGNGNGGFPRTTTVTVGQSPRYLAVADFNGDGTPDLAISNQGDGSVSILTSSGNGFDVSAPIPVGLNVEAITTGDFNHDGNADFAVIYNENSIAIFLGKGDGTFTPVAAHLTTDVEPTSIVTGDFNGDGNLDLIVSNAIGSGPQVNGNLTVLLGNGDGTFTPAASPSTGVNPESIAVGDFNNDGKLDLAVANNTSNTVTILLGNGDGTFSASSVATGASPWSVSVADFNGDGIPDILVVPAVGGTATTTVLFGKGDGTFSATTGPATGNAPLYGVIADFNSDGVPDFAISNAADSTLGIYLTQTSSTATAVVNNISPVGTGPHLVDATYGNSTSNTVSLTAQRVPTTLALTATAAPSGSPINLTAAISPNTAQDHSAGGTVTFYNNGVVLQPGNPVNVSGGVANLAIASLPAGLNSLSAQYSGDTNFAPSSGTGSITISPPPPADFTFIGPPTITFRTESNGVATLSLASLNGFAAPIAITCNTPLPPNYLCTLSSSTVTLAANNTTSLTMTLHPNLNGHADLQSPHGLDRSRAIVPITFAALFPLTLLALTRRKRRSPLRSLALLLCLAAAATALTACGSDIYYPATPPGIYPITVTATGTNQGASASTTHTLLLNANITP